MLPAQKKQLEMYLKKIREFHNNSRILFLIAAAIVFGTLLFYSYPQYKKVLSHKAEIRQTEEIMQEQQKVLTRVKRELQDKSSSYAVVLESIAPILEDVFPQKNPTDEVAKFLEEFAIGADTPSHPMKIESVAFAPVKEKNDYKILPFRLSVEADEYNFKRFMKQVGELSGSLQQQDFYRQLKPIPIMSIESISVSLPEEKDIDPALQTLSGGTVQKQVPTFVFNVEMQAYFRPQEAQDASQAHSPNS